MIPTIIWTQEMSVNVAVIDEQHKKLVEIINKLSSAINDNAVLATLNEVFDELTDYARIHFSTEEEFFKQVDYPDAAAHNQEHDDFIYKFISFRNDFENGNQVVSITIVDFLFDWLVEHIQGSDKAYSNLLNEKRIY